MKTDRGSFRMLSRTQLLQERIHDPYKPRAKLAAPVRCPACFRIRDRLPGAAVALSGRFFAARRDEVLAQVRNCERAEKETHPMQRIMAIAPTETGVLVTTTDAHLARRIGDALRRAYKGELDYRYHKADSLLRVSWHR